MIHEQAIQDKQNSQAACDEIPPNAELVKEVWYHEGHSKVTTSTAQTFVVGDPRHFDGDPYEVAVRAIRQAAAVNEILLECLQGAVTMARNAEMERNLYHHDDPKAAEWGDSLQGRRLDALIEQTRDTMKQLRLLEQAAGFDPRKVK
jgi:hypothetical protein